MNLVETGCVIAMAERAKPYSEEEFEFDVPAATFAVASVMNLHVSRR